MAEQKFDFKKEYKEFYLPKQKPALVDVPTLPFIMVDGEGAPAGSSYQDAIEILYALTFTVKMSKMREKKLNGYYEYVVPPLESLWWLPGGGFDAAKPREEWLWTAMIAQPDFVNEDVFAEAVEICKKKKPGLALARARFAVFTEGLCVQLLHVGPYHDEARSMRLLGDYIEENGWKNITDAQHKHHEIYLSDPRRTAEEKLKTVLRCPVAKG